MEHDERLDAVESEHLGRLTAADAEPDGLGRLTAAEAEPDGLGRLTAAEQTETSARSRPHSDRAPWTRSSGRGGSVSSWAWCWRPRVAAAVPRTTCCSPVLRGSARPRWR